MFNAHEYLFFYVPYLETLATASKKNRFNFARASSFFVHFFSINAWPEDESVYFMFCWGRKHKTMAFFFFSWTSTQSLEFNSRKIC